MNLLEHITIEHLHHAYLLEGERGVIIEELTLLLSDAGITQKGNADFHLYEHDAFLIEHAHSLRREQSMHGAEGARKIFIVAFNTMMSEAQNALLKTLEEPTTGTHFFFITRTGEILFPTVRSRMQVIRSKETGDRKQEAGNAGEKFLNASLAERMNMIEHLTKAKTEEKPKAKEDARIFLESLERALYSDIPNSLSNDNKFGISQKHAAALEDVITAKRYLSDRSPSLKLLLEHLALTVPKASEK
jgi:DNA polymerase III delta prime subunit